MSKQKPHKNLFGTISLVLSIIFLWGFGIALLIVILNCGIGYSDNKADFSTLFLNMAEQTEGPLVESYLQMYLHSKKNDETEICLNQALHTYQTHFSPENTNFRFVAMDSDGKVLLTNAPNVDNDMPMLASHVNSVNILLGERSYQIRKHFEDPVESYFEIVYGDASVYLDSPNEYQLWYFTNERVDAIYHEGLNLRIYDDPYVDYCTFDSLDAAKDFDYQSQYGELCEWSIEAASENPSDIFTTKYGEDSAFSDMADTVLVRVEAYASCTEVHDSLDRYYKMKQQGQAVTASDPALEKLLTDGLDITIRARHTDSMHCYIRTYLPEKLEIDDTIRSNYAVFSLLFRHSEWFVLLMFILLAFTVIASIAMCSAAGHPEEFGRDTVSRVHEIAYEFFWLLPFICVLGASGVLYFLYDIGSSYRIIAIFCIGMILCIAACCILWLYTTAVRIKAGTFWKSFGVVRVFSFLLGMLRNRTVTVIMILLLSLLIFFLNVVVLPNCGGIVFVIIGCTDLVYLLTVVYSVYAYFELHRHVKEMEKGNFAPASHPLPLGGDFERFDDSLNDITHSIEKVVAERTKAEHLRTELITNVSHDLKTPLTSIVNYVDLLSREPMQTAAADEYLEVLRRQAARLKKLTIDLVDASKASTGNLTVELMPTDLQVLISQIVGEYEDQLEAKELTLVLNIPEEPLMILADGRQIWRVLDNLLNNSCKYALPGTRVYLDVCAEDAYAKITLKNISAQPLNIAPDALMERFVRGDASRHTEGSGLGLSIARDLTTLQNGTLMLRTDGDLFKVYLEFPLYHAPDDPEKSDLPEV